MDVETGSLHTVKVPAEFFSEQEETFIDAVQGKSKQYLPDICEGAKCQKIVDAVLESSEKNAVVKIM